MPSRRVLLVEDNPDARETLAQLLQLRGLDVVTAADGPSAVQKALHCHPQVAIVDIGLPFFDGYEVARQIRAQTEAPIRLVALTAWGGPEDRRRGLEAGFDAYLVKPALVDELVSQVDP